MSKKKNSKQPYIIEKVISEKKYLGDGVTFETKYECIEGKSDLVIGNYKVGIMGVTVTQCEELSKRMEALLLEFYTVCEEENRVRLEAEKEKQLVEQLSS